MTQWAEIRQMHWVDGVPKKEVARRLGLDVKTVRRALERVEPPHQRQSPPRGRQLDPFRDEIEQLLRDDPRITAKRIGRLLRPKTGWVGQRTVRQFVAAVRSQVRPREAFVHRTHAPGDTMEVDFGEAWAEIAGERHKVKFLVVTLPASNTYFAKAYRLERLECLLDGILEAFRWFRGMPRRLVLDNTSLAVREVLKGPERIENRTFEAFRGAFPVHADFCAPAKGWEKGSVERGVRYVRDLGLRPVPRVESLEELNALLLQELEQDLDRKHPDGRTALQALIEEREHLRPLPTYWPEACRVLPKVADKFGHVRLDGSTYSVPTEHCYRPVIAKLYPDRVELSVADQVVARHVRSFVRGALVLDPLHVLRLVERKHRAAGEATALMPGLLSPVFFEIREALRKKARKADQEWVSILRLMEGHCVEDVEGAVREALQRGSPRLETVRMLLRQSDGESPEVEAVPVARDDLASFTVEVPSLDAWDAVTEDLG